MPQVMLNNEAHILWEAFRRAFEDLTRFLPALLLSVLIVAVYILVGVVLNSILRRFLTFLRVDELIAPITRQIRIRPSSLIIGLVDFGLAILAIYTIILFIAPVYVEIANEFVYYIARVASIIVLITISFVFLNILVSYIRLETKLRGFMFLTLLFITLILVFDVAALSPEIKTALAWGISIGLAVLIASFSVWYFFHEILEKKTSD
ncbi:MAG: hypothetical protein ABWW65_05020 [Thermoprotei archaeon]